MGIFSKSVFLLLLVAMSSQSYANVNKSSKSIKTAVKASTGKQDLVGLFQFFEDNCGFDDNYNPTNNPSKKRFEDFKNTFVAHSDSYYVKPLSNIPAKYRNVVKSIQMVQDDREVIHYYVSFKNATYRGYDLDKLDVSFIPYSEYDYHDHLYFKDASFLALKPSFKFPGTGWQESDEEQGFNREKLSITCDGVPH